MIRFSKSGRGSSWKLSQPTLKGSPFDGIRTVSEEVPSRLQSTVSWFLQGASGSANCTAAGNEGAQLAPFGHSQWRASFISSKYPRLLWLSYSPDSMMKMKFGPILIRDFHSRSIHGSTGALIPHSWWKWKWDKFWYENSDPDGSSDQILSRWLHLFFFVTMITFVFYDEALP